MWMHDRDEVLSSNSEDQCKASPWCSPIRRIKGELHLPRFKPLALNTWGKKKQKTKTKKPSTTTGLLGVVLCRMLYKGTIQPRLSSSFMHC